MGKTSVDSGPTKGAGNSSLRADLRNIRQLRGQMNREAGADYRVTQSANTAATANLTRQVGQSRRLLSGTIRNTTRSLDRLASKSKNVQAGLAASEQRTINRYGTGMAGAIGQAYKPGKVAAAGAVKVQGALAAQGKAGARVSKMVESLAVQEAKAQGSAADYALAQAFEARNAINSETIAQLEGQAYQTALQYNQQLQLFKKEKAINEGKLPNEAQATADRLSTEGTAIALDAKKYWQNTTDEHGKVIKGVAHGASIGDSALAYAAENGYDANGPEVKLFTATLQALKHTPQQKGSITIAYKQAVQWLYGGDPNYTDAMIRQIEAAAAADELRHSLVLDVNAPPGPPGPPGPTLPHPSTVYPTGFGGRYG